MPEISCFTWNCQGGAANRDEKWAVIEAMLADNADFIMLQELGTVNDYKIKWHEWYLNNRQYNTIIFDTFTLGAQNQRCCVGLIFNIMKWNLLSEGSCNLASDGLYLANCMLHASLSDRQPAWGVFKRINGNDSICVMSVHAIANNSALFDLKSNINAVDKYLQENKHVIKGVIVGGDLNFNAQQLALWSHIQSEVDIAHNKYKPGKGFESGNAHVPADITHHSGQILDYFLTFIRKDDNNIFINSVVNVDIEHQLRRAQNELNKRLINIANAKTHADIAVQFHQYNGHTNTISTVYHDSVKEHPDVLIHTTGVHSDNFTPHWNDSIGLPYNSTSSRAIRNYAQNVVSRMAPYQIDDANLRLSDHFPVHMKLVSLI